MLANAKTLEEDDGVDFDSFRTGHDRVNQDSGTVDLTSDEDPEWRAWREAMTV